MEVPVGGTVYWTLHGFHNRTGAAVNGFAIVDMPGVGLNFVSGSIPAFTNSAGVTYDVRYMVQGSNVWRTLVSGVNASAPFTFALPQPGDLHYTDIGLFFGTVPAYFGLGDTITFTFVAGNSAPNNELVNHFIVLHGGGNATGYSPYVPILRPPVGGGQTQPPNGDFGLDDQGVPLGQIPQTGISTAVYWLAAVFNLVLVAGIGTLCMMKVKKRKRLGGAR